MEITVNKQNFAVADNCSLQQMYADVLQQPAKGLAIAVNEEIIPKADWESYCLKPGDQIILIKATQGG